MFAPGGLYILGVGCICTFDRAAKLITISRGPVVANRGASTFWLRRWPKVREPLLILFAGQRGRLFPHLTVSCRGIMGFGTSLDRTSNLPISFSFKILPISLDFLQRLHYKNRYRTPL